MYYHLPSLLAYNVILYTLYKSPRSVHHSTDNPTSLARWAQCVFKTLGIIPSRAPVAGYVFW